MQIKTFNHVFTFQDGKCYRDGHYFGEIVEDNDRYFVVKTKNELKTFMKHGRP
jgi:hypothetical protein